MEQTATSSSTVPQYTSKLQELLTADRSTLRSDFANASNAASLSRGSTGDDGTKSSDAVPEEYRNPRKRLLLSSMNASESDKTTDNQNEKGKKIMKKTEVSTGESTNKANEGPDSFKVAPLILKKYYPSAVQSAECEEFLVSLTAEDSLTTEDPFKTGAKDEVDKCVNGNSKPLNYDYEYMGAQIDKLLGMSDSPSASSSSGNKAAWKASRRQRRHQCEVCPKSYSTEDDLKSHILSHSLGESAKPFECEHCDKKFKWVASLKGHKRKVHKEMRSTPGTEDEGESSEGEESPPSQGDTPAAPVAVKGNPEAASKSVPPMPPTKLSLQEQAQSFESVVSKMLSSGLVSHNQIVNNTVEKALPPRRKCSTAKEKPEAPPSRRSTTRKDSKSSNNNMKEVNDAKRKIAVVEQPDDSPSPVTPNNRTSLRRNIQRPKWLTDADLVTDYEFPRGTNIMRTGNGNSPSTSATVAPTMNGNQAKARTASTESNEDSGKNQKSDRGKVNPPPSVERKVKEDGPAPKVVKIEPKKETVKKVIKKEPKKKRVTKAARAAAIKDEPLVNEPEPQPGPAPEPAPAPGPAPAPANQSPSPTKQLRTKILSLSLSEENNEEAEAAAPIAAPAAAPEKNSRKRPKSQSPKAPKGSGGRKKPKRKLAEEEVEENNADEPPSFGNATPPNPKAEPINGEIALDDAVFDSEVTSNSMSVQAGEGVQPRKIENQNTEKSSTDTTTAVKRCEVAAIFLPKERHSSGESITAQNNKIVYGLETATKTVNSIESNKAIQNDNSVLPFSFGSSGSIIAAQKIETQIQATAPFSFYNSEEVSTFADLAKGTATIPIEESTAESSPVADESVEEEEAEDQDLQEEVVNVNGAKLPNLTNDEDMPVLKPEASSSAAVSRSESFAERMESIDEDVSNSSSHHSVVPLNAPVLSKEATPAGVNGGVKVPMDCKTVSSESTVIDQDEEEELVQLPVIEGEEEAMGRDRSDSLSMRSCGSGSPSEKIKNLDDAASKDNEKVDLSDDDDDEDGDDQECLPDSDSNDSLMSEFSELAAQLSEKTDGVKVKEECIRFLTNKVSANSMWLIRKELKRLKKDKNYFKFGKLSPLAAGLMHDIFCQSLR